MSSERFDTLDLRRMAHPPLRDGTPVCSNDLLHVLGHGERAGCFISTSERRNLAARKRLLLQAEPDTERGGVLIYACTCGGDLGCGGLIVRVQRDATAYTWSDFALESGLQPIKLLPHVGPFRFQRGDYVTAVHNAAMV